MSRDWQKDMTREEILAMKPGQTDRHIHEMLFGGEDLSEFEYKGNGSYVKVTDTSVIWRDIPNYSTDISAAWEVEKRIKQLNDEMGPMMTAYYMTELLLIVGNNGFDMVHATPEQRCKASLLAVLEGINLPGEETT